MFKTSLSLLALAFVIAVSSAQMTTYYQTSNGVPDGSGLYDQGYTTVHKEVTTYTGNGQQGLPMNYVETSYNTVPAQGQGGNGWNVNNGGSGNDGGSGGGKGSNNGGGLFGLASNLFKTTLATGAGILGGAAGAVLGGTKGASLLANTGANMVYRS